MRLDHVDPLTGATRRRYRGLLSAQLAIVMILYASSRASAQQCQNGIYVPGDGPNLWTHEVFPWTDYFVPLSRLGNQYMPQLGDGDSMTETFWSGISDTYHPFGSAGFQETWYVPRDSASNNGPLYRFYGAASTNHLDQPTSTPPTGYTLEFTEGYPWTLPVTGTKPITRYLKLSIFDHRTWLNSVTPAGYAVDSVWNSGSTTPRYGFERFGNCLARDAVLNINSCTVGCANPYQYSLTNSTLKVEFNSLWGNAVGKITYLPANRQIVTYNDIGSLVQSTVWTSFNQLDVGQFTCCRMNPTQSGGVDNFAYANTLRWTGSPVISSTYGGIGTPIQSLTSVLKPLNFATDINVTTPAGSSTDRYSPMLWRGTFQEIVTIGATVAGVNYDDVFKIHLGAVLDVDVPPSVQKAYTLNHVLFLTLPVDFFEDFDLGSGSVGYGPPRGDASCGANPAGILCLTQTNTNHGAIAAMPGSTFAVGVFHVDHAGATFVEGSYLNGFGGSSSGTIMGTLTNYTINTSTYTTDEAVVVVGPLPVVETRLQQVYCSLFPSRCTPPAPPQTVSRRRIARELVQARGEQPPALTTCANPTRFADVPCSATDWGFIEKVAADGLTAGCGGGLFCPNNAVTNAQMAVLVTKAFYCPLNTLCPAGAVTPGNYPGWTDIANNPSDPNYAYLPYIDRGFDDTDSQTHTTHIWSGCSLTPLKFCPGTSTTDVDMNTYLSRYWSK